MLFCGGRTALSGISRAGHRPATGPPHYRRPGGRRRVPAGVLRPGRPHTQPGVLRPAAAGHPHRRPGGGGGGRAVRGAGARRGRARPVLVVDLALHGSPAAVGRPGDERRRARREPAAGAAGGARPQRRPHPAVPRRLLRRRHLLRVGGLPRRAGRGVPRGGTGAAAGRAVRGHVLEPLLPDQGDPRLAGLRRRAAPAVSARSSALRRHHLAAARYGRSCSAPS